MCELELHDEHVFLYQWLGMHTPEDEDGELPDPSDMEAMRLDALPLHCVRSDCDFDQWPY